MIYLRHTYIKRIEKALNILPIVVLIGARQVGKTTLLRSLDIPGKHVLLNGQDPEIIEIFQSFSTLENYLKIKINNTLDGYLLIDEFQFIPNISTLLKLLVDKFDHLKILCTGSSSLDILQNVNESMAGRVRVIEVFSLSFSEYLLFVDDEMYQLYQKYQTDTSQAIIDKKIQMYLDNYLIYGGLPRVALVEEDTEKVELLEDIYRTYLMRDIRSYIRNQDVVGFNRLLKLLAAQIGNLVNINELSNTCGLSYKKTEEYLFLLEQMYIIKLVDPFYTNKRKVITKMRKVFFNDLGMCNLINNTFGDFTRSINKGNLLENYVFLELKRLLRQTGKLFYYRTLDGAEIDFIIDHFKGLISVEVKNKALKKEISLRNLDSFNNLFNVSNSYIVNAELNMVGKKYNFIQASLVPKLDFNNMKNNYEESTTT
jgi:hypothetical protein